MPMGQEHLRPCVAAVGRTAGQQEVEGAAQAVDVGSRICPLGVGGLFGRHVRDRSQDGPARGSVIVVVQPRVGEDDPSEAEVEDSHRVGVVEHQVGGLDVAVNDLQ
jgi:hypothetical protein